MTTPATSPTTILMNYIVTDNYRINDITTWNIPQFLLFCSVIWLGLEIMQQYLPKIFILLIHPKLIDIRGKHLDKLETLDMTFILINKCLTILFVYHVIQVTFAIPSIQWNPEDLTIFNTVGSYVAFFIFYDYFYMWFHRILHIRALYPLIHKHHHRQKAPSRGNLDAINVHPIEYFIGEYLHLVTIYVIPCHIYTVIAFIITGGILASLNHTRLDLNLPFGLYSVKVHDIHHRLPESNYAQYTMYWDRLHGSYRSYEKTLSSDGNEKSN